MEATKFTEVGYVGRDVESMVRDLTEAGVRIVREEKREEVKEQATKLANERLVKLIVPEKKKQSSGCKIRLKCFSVKKQEEEEPDDEEEAEVKQKRSDIARSLHSR